MSKFAIVCFCLLSCGLLSDEPRVQIPEQPGSVGSFNPLTPPATSASVTVEQVHVRFADRARLAFQRPGTILTIAVREGDQVRAGQVVASLDSAVAEAEYQLARLGAEIDSEIRLADKRFASAQHEFELVRNGNADARTAVLPFPEGDVIRLKLAAESAEAETEVRRDQQRLAELRAAQALAEVNAYSIKAPFDGLVTRVQKSAGESVQQADVIAEIVNTQSIVIDGYVDLESSLKMQRGCRAEFTTAHELQLPGHDVKPHVGELRLVDVTLEEVREVVRISAVFPNPDGLLREGISGTLRIYPGAGDQAATASAKIFTTQD